MTRRHTAELALKGSWLLDSALLCEQIIMTKVTQTQEGVFSGFPLHYDKLAVDSDDRLLPRQPSDPLAGQRKFPYLHDLNLHTYPMPNLANYRQTSTDTAQPSSQHFRSSPDRQDRFPLAYVDI